MHIGRSQDKDLEVALGRPLSLAGDDHAAAVAIVETWIVCVLVRRFRGHPEVRVG